MRYRHAIAVWPVLCALAACDPSGPPAAPARDPIVVAALNGPLMTDPDLVGQNQPGAVFALAGPPSAPIPLIDRSDDEVASARAEADGLTGSAAPKAAPAEDRADALPGLTPADTAARVLAQVGGPRTCADRARYTAAWGARLPEALPIYPRGHLLDAAGIDAADCRLRAVTYLTPVASDDVVNFYWARAVQAGLSPAHARSGEHARVAAARGSKAFAAYVRSRDGVTEVTLVTTGF